MGEPAPKFDHYDEAATRGLVQAHERAAGLPGWLGITLVETWPGGLRAQLEVRDELLTPFRNLHGGVLAALVDHVLGTVCYPVMPAGSWAATTEFKLNYLAPVTGGILSAVAEVISLTRRTAVVRIAVTNRLARRPAGRHRRPGRPAGRHRRPGRPAGRHRSPGVLGPGHRPRDGPEGPPRGLERAPASAGSCALVTKSSRCRT